MTGKVANVSNYPHGFGGGLVLEGLATHRAHSGRVLWVAAGSDGTAPTIPNIKGASNTNKGTYLEPLKTLTYAVEQANAGDTIAIHPGFVDDIETALDIENANITILGIGTGSSRPQITPGVLNALDVEAANVTLQNLYFNEAPGATTTVIDVVGAGARLIGCHADLGANDTEWCTITATGDSFSAIGNRFVVTANGTDDIFDIEGASDQAYFDDNVYVTSVANPDTSMIDAKGAATNTYLGKGEKLIGGGTHFVGATAVGTVDDRAAGATPLIEVSAITGALTIANDEAFKAFAVDGAVDIHGIWLAFDGGADAGDDWGVVVSGQQLVAETEIAAADAVGDVAYAASAGASATVDEVGTAETVLFDSPVAIREAAGAETAFDVELTGGGEAEATMYVAWSSADGTGEIVTS